MKTNSPSPVRRAIGPALLLALALMLSPAYAGFITITVDPGSTATFSWDTDGDGVRDREVPLEDVNQDGKIEYGFGTLEEEKKIGSVWVVKKSDGYTIGGEVKLDTGEKSLGSLEPFDFPGFTATTTIVASIDMPAFLAAGNPFTIGQILNVTNGTIAESPHIIFKDGSSLPANPAFSRNLVAALPNFTGTVRVFSFDSAAPPEPSPVVLSIAFAQRTIGKVAALTWPGTPGAAYKVQYRTTLSARAAWLDFDVVTATGATATSEVPLSLAGSGAQPNEMFFRLVLPASTVSGLQPGLINTGGGQIYITGQGFAPGDVVLIGGVAMPTTFISSTLLLVAAPPLAAGTYNITILRGDDTIASLPASLTVTSGLALETLELPGLPPGAPVVSSRNLKITVQFWGNVSAGPGGPRSGEDCDDMCALSGNAATGGAGGAGGCGGILSSIVGLRVPGRGLDFIWATTYRSRGGEATTMGNNWSHSYNIRCSANGADMEVRDGTGRHDTYFLQPDGSFSRHGFFRRGTLAGTTFTLEFADKGRWVFRPLDGSPAAGRIAQSIDRNGNALQFFYDGAGRLAQILDTLGHTYQVQYNAGGRIAAVIDFTGRAVTYTYYGAGDPNGANGDLKTMTSPAVNGTPTGNDFPTGKTTTFTYSTGFGDARLNSNLLTITDPKGQTSQRFVYSTSNNPLDVNFDRVVSIQRGNQADPKDKPSMFTWLQQTPTPGNGYAVLKRIANDPVGNVRETFFDSRNLPVRQLDYTGRAVPGIATTEVANRPAGQLRAGDPATFETLAHWNINFLPTCITLPRGNARAFTWETDFNPAASVREAGNLRVARSIPTAGDVLTTRMERLPGFGTCEQCFVSRLMEEEGIFYCEGDPDRPIIVGSVYNLHMNPRPSPYLSDWQQRAGIWAAPELKGNPGCAANQDCFTVSIKPGGRPAPAPIRGALAVLPGQNGCPPGQNCFDVSLRPGIWAAPELKGDPGCAANQDCFTVSIKPGGRPAPAPVRGALAVLPGQNGCPPGQNCFDVSIRPGMRANNWVGCVGCHPRGQTDNVTWHEGLPGTGWVGCTGCHPQGQTDNVTWNLKSPGPLFQVTRSGMLPEGNYELCVSITNPRGHTTTATYDAAGNRTQIQSPLAGTADTFTYNAFGQLTSHAHPTNGSAHVRTDTFSYYNGGPQNGWLDAVVADSGALNLTAHYEYDPRGNITRTVDPNGNDWLFTRNALNQMVRASSPVVNGARNECDFIYDADNNVTRVDVQNRDETGALGANTHFSRTFTFDFLNRVTSCEEEIDTLISRTTQFSYDGNRNLTRIALPEAVSGTDPANVIDFVHDERDLPFRTIRASGAAEQSTTQYDYDPNGNLATHQQGTENAPRITTFAHDGHDRFVGSTDAAGNVRALTLDDCGNVTRMTVTGNAEPLPAVPRQLFAANYTYNPLNLPVSSQVEFFNPLTGVSIGDGARTTTLARAANMEITSVTDDNGHATSHAYDGAGRLSRVTDARGNRTDYTRDANGNTMAILLTDKRDSGAPDEQFQRTFSYDALDRLSSAQDNVGNTSTPAYDSRGNVTLVTDPRGTVTRYTYDGLSRRLESIEDMDATGTDTPPDIKHTYSYDLDSRLVLATDDNGHQTQHAYDSLGRELGVLQADGTARSRTYDVHDNVTSMTDANGTVVTCTYDALNRLTDKTITPGGGVAATTTFEQFSHDGMSRLLRAVNDNSTVTFTYDSLGHLRTETAGALTTSSTYDAVGNRLSLTYPGGSMLTYDHDAINRVTAVHDGAATLSSTLYAGRDRIERVDYGNGTRLSVGYDGVLGTIPVGGDFGWRKPVSLTHSKIAGGAVIHDLSHLWDPNQNKIARSQLTPFTLGGPLQARSFDYDADDRPIHSNVTLGGAPFLDTQYGLDGEGNRLQVIGGINPGAYTRDPTAPVPADDQANQYTTTPFDARQYDENGNVRLTNPASPNGVFRFMTYDYSNRLVSAQLVGGTYIQYTYDALGRRIGRDVAPPGPPIVIVTRFVYAGNKVIEERDAGGAVLANIRPLLDVDGNGQPDAQTDGLLQISRNGQDYWLHTDDAGNTLALTDATGAVVERYDYDDYGTVRFLDATGALLPGATQSAAGNPYLFRSLRYEPEPRFFLAGGGYWDPQAARFIARTGGGNGGQIFFNVLSKEKPDDIKGADLEKALARKEKPADIKGADLE